MGSGNGFNQLVFIMINVLEILGKIGFDWQVALANLVNFLIILYLLKKFAFKPIKNIIQERQNKISEGLEKAEEAEVRLKDIDQIAKKLFSKAQNEALAIVSLAEKKAIILSEELEEKMEEKKKQANQLLKSEFLRQKEVMNQEVLKNAINLVKEVIVKTVELKPEQIDEALVEKAVSRLSKEV